MSFLYRVFRVVDRIDDFVIWMNLVGVLIEYSYSLSTFTICLFVILHCSCVCSSPVYCHSLWVTCIMHSEQMMLNFNDWNIDLEFVGSKVCRCSRYYCHMCSKYLLHMDYPGRYNIVVIVYLMWVVVVGELCVVYVALPTRLSFCSMGCENRNSFTQRWWTSLTWYAFLAWGKVCSPCGSCTTVHLLSGCRK